MEQNSSIFIIKRVSSLLHFMEHNLVFVFPLGILLHGCSIVFPYAFCYEIFCFFFFVAGPALLWYVLISSDLIGSLLVHGVCRFFRDSLECIICSQTRTNKKDCVVNLINFCSFNLKNLANIGTSDLILLFHWMCDTNEYF